MADTIIGNTSSTTVPCPGSERTVELPPSCNPKVLISRLPTLLTGERPEPTYLIAKPFLPETVQATVGQALFFHPVAREAA
mgnify:FL=1